VGHGNACHISFHVKDDIDLNAFAKTLEEECQRRGIKNVVCNRVINVHSEEERRNAALKYYANKFWNDPEYFVEGYSDGEFGDFHGWSLFYCKGPNGEQLEFNQVTRRARECSTARDSNTTTPTERLTRLRDPGRAPTSSAETRTCQKGGRERCHSQHAA